MPLTSTTFTNVTSEAGNFITARSYGAGSWGNFNGDEFPDLWVNNHFGGNNFGRTLFVNNGDGTFTDVVNVDPSGNEVDYSDNDPDVFILEELRGDYHGAAWVDIDNDGDQDLIQVAGGEGNTSVVGQENTGDKSDPNRLYINDNGVLRNQADEFGLAYNSAKAQLVVLFDYDNDGRVDLFHGSTQRADGLNPTTVFRQKEDGTFEDVGEDVLPESLKAQTVRLGGIGYFSNETLYDLVFPGFLADVYDLSTEPFENITVDTVGSTQVLKGARDFAFADFNNDSLMDIYITRGGDDRLLLTNSDGSLTSVGESAGIEAVNTNVGSGVVAADFDNDMDVDILVIRGNNNGANLSNVLFDNQGDGTFKSIENAGGVLAASEGVADGATIADYDLDGFIDVFVTNGTGEVGPAGGPQLLFRNQGNDNNWLEIDLEGVTSNRDGIGAKVFVTTADGVTQRRDQDGGVHTSSQDHQRLHFGLAQNTQIESIRIEWPSGIVQDVDVADIEVNDLYRITEAGTVTDGSGNNGGGNNGGNGGGNNGGGTEVGPFTPVSSGNSLELTTLGNNAVKFGFDSVNVSKASLVTVFKVEGGSRTQIGSFSLLQAGSPVGFTPGFTLSGDDISEGDTLEFEIVNNGQTRSASITSAKTGASLDFGNGTKLSLSSVADNGGPNYVSGDADALNFGGIGGADVSFTVYREAKFDSVVGLYKVDNINGDITVGGQTLSIGDSEYEQAALDNALDAELRTSNGDADTFTVSGLDGFYGTFITVQNSERNEDTTYFSYSALNSGSSDHVKSIGNNAIGFEDLPGLGDADFDDIVITFDTIA